MERSNVEEEDEIEDWNSLQYIASRSGVGGRVNE